MSRPDPASAPRKTVHETVPVLNFHGLRQGHTPLEKQLNVPPKRFCGFLRFLRMIGYETVTADEIVDGTAHKYPVAITFDDGFAELHDELLPCLEEFRFNPLLFIVAGEIGGSNVWDCPEDVARAPLLNASQIKRMAERGVSFGSHSMTHAFLPKLDAAALKRELIESKDVLEQLLGAQVDWFAYPYGRADARVCNAVMEAGYKAAFTVGGGLANTGDRYFMRRVPMGDADDWISLYSKLKTGRPPGLFLLKHVLDHGKRTLLSSGTKRQSR